MNEGGDSALQRVLLVAEDGDRLRALADRLWAADYIAYCARSRLEVLDLLGAGLRLDLILVDPCLGDSFVTSLREDLARYFPRLSLEVQKASADLTLQ